MKKNTRYRRSMRATLVCFAFLASASAETPSSSTLGWSYERRYDQNAYLESHNSYASIDGNHYSGGIYTGDLLLLANQRRFLLSQLDNSSAVRSLDLRYYTIQETIATGSWNAKIWCDEGDKRASYDTLTESSLCVLSGFQQCSYDGLAPKIVMGHHIEWLGYTHLIGSLPQASNCKNKLEGFAANGRAPQPGLMSFLFQIFWWLSQPKNRTEIITINAESRVPPHPIRLNTKITAFESDLATRQLFSIAQGMMSKYDHGERTITNPGYGRYSEGETGRKAGLDLIQNDFDNAEWYTYLDFDGLQYTNILPVLIFNASPNRVNYGYPITGGLASEEEPALTPLVPKGAGIRSPRPGGLRPAPDGHNQPGWWVPMDGFPTIRQMVANRMRLVVLPDGKTWGREKAWAESDNYGSDRASGVKTDTAFYGFYESPSDLWTAHGPAQGRSLFMMENSPDEATDWSPLLGKALPVVSRGFYDRINRVIDTYKGIPNFLRSDFTTEHTSYEDATRQLNAEWAKVPQIEPRLLSRSREPGPTGWNNTNVDVAFGGLVRSSPPRNVGFVNYDHFYEKVTLANPTNVPYSFPVQLGDQNPLAHIGIGTPGRGIWPGTPVKVCREGKNVITFSGVDTPIQSGTYQGVHSVGDRGYIDVWIDRVAPTIQFRAETPPGKTYLWYKDDVVVSFSGNDDPRPGAVADGVCSHTWEYPVSTSGIDPANSTSRVVVSTEGRNLVAAGRACDLAGNCATAEYRGFHLDKTKPVLSVQNHQGLYAVDEVVDIRCVATDNLATATELKVSCPGTIQAYDLPTGTSRKPRYSAFNASAEDLAGNVGTINAPIGVYATPAALGRLTLKLTQGRSMPGLQSKATALLTPTDSNTRRTQLSTFQNEVTLAAAANQLPSWQSALFLKNIETLSTELAADCVLSQGAYQVSVPAAGGSGALSFVGACGVAPSSDSAWLSSSMSASGVTFTAAANPGPGPRMGQLRFTDATFTVLQQQPACYHLPENQLTVPAAETRPYIAVNVRPGCAALNSVRSFNVPWLDMDPGLENYPPAQGASGLFIRILANTGAARLGVITIGDQTFTVRQLAPAPAIPVTGLDVPLLRTLDEAMIRGLQNSDTPGAALAVSYQGKIVYARGFGYADLSTLEPVQPDSLFRLASVSKLLTYLAIRDLVLRGQLSLSTRATSILGLSPPPGQTVVDARWNDITIEQLLNHTAGFNTSIAGDRSTDTDYMTAAAAALNTSLPGGNTTNIRYALGRTLDYPPGDPAAVAAQGTSPYYSNFGYQILGRIVERVSGTSFENYVRSRLWGPAAVTRGFVARSFADQRHPGEVKYYAGYLERAAPSVFADRPGLAPPTYGSIAYEQSDSFGGMVMHAPDLIRLVETWLPFGPYGDFHFFGELAGTNTVAARLKNGVAVSLLTNHRKGLEALLGPVETVLQSITTWPTSDAGAAYSGSNPVCSFQVIGGPNALTAPPGSGVTSRMIQTSAGCGWSAVSDAPWVTFNSSLTSTGRVGTGIQQMEWSPLTGTSPRTARIYVAGQVITLTQTPTFATIEGPPRSPEPDSIMEVGGAGAKMYARVRALDGSPLPNVAVTFTAPEAGPSARFAGGTRFSTVITDSNGIATAFANANNVPGNYIVVATSPLATGQADLRVRNDSFPSALQMVSGDNQLGVVGEDFNLPLTVRVINRAGLPMGGVSLSFQSLAGANGATGFLNSTTAPSASGSTAPDGTVTIRARANLIPGPFQVRAATGTFPALFANFTLTNVALPIPSGTPRADVTSQVSIFSSGLAYNRLWGVYMGTITVKNTGTTTIPGPLHLVLTNFLPAEAAWRNFTGTSTSPPGRYRTISTGPLAPGAQVVVDVEFTNTNPSQAIQYVPRVISGSIF